MQLEDMQDLVDEVQVNQQQQVRVPHPRRQQQKWKVIPCPDYHYKKVCVRGLSCRNAHELVGADEAARGLRPRPSSLPPALGGGDQRQQNLGRGGGKKKYTTPVYNPEHPHYNQWAQEVRASSQGSLGSAQGNAPGLVRGAAPVRQQPQQQVQGQARQPPQGGAGEMRPRSYSEATAASTSASSDSTAAARQTVGAAMAQQSSVRAHLEEMEDPRWRAALEAVRGAIRLPPSLESNVSGERSSSLGDLTSRRSGM